MTPILAASGQKVSSIRVRSTTTTAVSTSLFYLITRRFDLSATSVTMPGFNVWHSWMGTTCTLCNYQCSKYTRVSGIFLLANRSRHMLAKIEACWSALIHWANGLKVRWPSNGAVRQEGISASVSFPGLGTSGHGFIWYGVRYPRQVYRVQSTQLRHLIWSQSNLAELEWGQLLFRSIWGRKERWALFCYLTSPHIV